MSELNINRKILPIGSVCYYVDKYAVDPISRNNKWRVAFGTIEEHYIDTVAIQLYELRDMRLVNGVPINEFKTPTEWQKLPKGWTYSIKLFDITHAEFSSEYLDADTLKEIIVKWNNPDNVLEAIQSGVLVKVQDNDHCTINAEIDSHKGYRLRREYPMWRPSPRTCESIHYNDVYATYDEAEKVVKCHEEQLKKMAEMTDLEWSIATIDNTLNHWTAICQISEIEKEKIRNFLMNLENLEDVEVRLSSCRIEWKYWKEKRWKSINV